MTLDELNQMDRDAFVAALGGVFEKSPWIAERAWTQRPFAGREAILEAMCAVVHAADEEARLRLIRAHPDLAGKAARAGALTPESTREQAGAGLDRLSDEEFDRFHRLNAAYMRRFGFPFIIAVGDHGKDGILAAFEARLENDRSTEIRAALENIRRIVELRLAGLVTG